MSTDVSTMGAFSRLFPPSSGCDPGVMDAPAWARPYKSARTRAIIATIALSLILASTLFLVWIIQHYDAAVDLFGDENNLRIGWTVISVAMGLGGVVTFFLWVGRAYRNLPALGANELEYSPRSAIAWWLVPLVSLVVPLRMMIELWRASDPSIRPNGRSDRQRAPFPKLLLTWWIVLWASFLLDRLTISSEDALWFAVVCLLQVLAAGLAIAVIWMIQLRQDAGQTVPAQGGASRLGLILGLTGAGGCLGVIALVVILAVFFLRGAMEKCPPKDFPVYPGAHQTDFNYMTSWATSSCSVGWESDDGSAQVSAFYDSSLTTGAWQLVNKDPESGLWYFQRRTDASVIGRIGFSGNGTQTRIEAEILTGQLPSPSGSP